MHPLFSMLSAIRTASRAIARNSLRSSLTVLGILIGVAAVTIVTALGAGARENIAQKIQSFGSNFVIVFPQTANASGARGAQGTGARLTEDDGRAVEREAVSISAVAPALRVRAQIVYLDKNWSTSVVGSTTKFFSIRNWKVARGESWTAHDEALKAKVCVLGSTAAKNLFATDDPIGHGVRIGRYIYTVLGVLGSKGETPFGEDQDDVVLMPIGTMRTRVMRTPPGFAGVLMMSATTAETTSRAVTQVESILRQRHRIASGREPDFKIIAQKQFQELQASVSRMLTLLLISIAGISLLVGGIGVMNIMLVSVAERTREIGIRMAIGAREGDIRAQFLIEAVVLSVLGGAAGALVGATAIRVLAAVLGWNMGVSPAALLVSLLTSAATGITFGFVPARSAARLDPIEALRHE